MKGLSQNAALLFVQEEHVARNLPFDMRDILLLAQPKYCKLLCLPVSFKAVVPERAAGESTTILVNMKEKKRFIFQTSL